MSVVRDVETIEYRLGDIASRPSLRRFNVAIVIIQKTVQCSQDDVFALSKQSFIDRSFQDDEPIVNKSVF